MKSVLKNEIFPLFLIISFPINTWSIYVFFYNFEWVAERTTIWDAIGYAAYSLTFALFESLIVTLLITPIYLIMRKSHDKDTSIAILGATIYLISFWVIVGRINASQDTSITMFLLDMKRKYRLRLRYFYPLIFVIIGAIAASMIFPPFIIKKSNKLQKIIIELCKRLELLSYFYLTLNLISITIVIIRNKGDI